MIFLLVFWPRTTHGFMTGEKQRVSALPHSMERSGEADGSACGYRDEPMLRSMIEGRVVVVDKWRNPYRYKAFRYLNPS
jgi:hypothetical protein